MANKIYSNLDKQHIEQITFMEQRSQFLVGRDELVNKVLQYIESGPDVSQLLERLSLVTERSPIGSRQSSAGTPTGRWALSRELTVPALLVSGDAGAGKSALLAHCACRAMANEQWLVVAHFVGATSGSTSLLRLIARLWNEILNVEENEIPTNADELKHSLEAVLRRGSARLSELKKQRLVVFIDAVNQMDDQGDALDLTWLPKQLPENVRLVVSALEGRALNVLRAAALPEVAVGPLTADARRSITQQLIKDANREPLSEAKMSQLLAKTDSGNALWLTLVCQNLHTFPDVEDISPTLAGLIRQVLERVISSAEEGSELVQAALSLICASRFGLLEGELQELLADWPLVPQGAALPSTKRTFVLLFSPQSEKRIPKSQWEVVVLDLRQFLRPSGDYATGRLDFYHRAITKAVKSLLFSDEQVLKQWHRRLADYFEQRCGDISRKCVELPFQLEALDESERLQGFLLERRAFHELYKEDIKFELLAHWRAAAGYEVAGTRYREAFAKWQQEDQAAGRGFLATFETGLSVGCLLTELGQFESGEAHLRALLVLVERHVSADSHEAGRVLLAIVRLCRAHLKKFVYGGAPKARKIKATADEFVQRCIKLLQQHWQHDSVEYAEGLMVCSQFTESDERGALRDEALAVFEAQHVARGLVEVWALRGVHEQYNEDLEVARKWHEKALAVAHSQLGRYHELTALAYQLYGQTLWNRLARNHSMASDKATLEECLQYYAAECEILTQLFGAAHPVAVRSREDCIIIISEQLHGHEEELKEYQRIQDMVKNAADDIAAIEVNEASAVDSTSEQTD